MSNILSISKCLAREPRFLLVQTWPDRYDMQHGRFIISSTVALFTSLRPRVLEDGLEGQDPARVGEDNLDDDKDAIG